MNWVDLAIIIFILAFAIEGQRRGFFVQIFDIFSFLTSLLFSLMLYSKVADLLIKFFDLPRITANPVGFLIVWVFTEIVLVVVFSSKLKGLLKRFSTTPINRLLGFIPASLNALLLLSFILLFVISLPLQTSVKKDIFDSKIANFLVSKATRLEQPLNGVFGPIAKQGLTFLTVKPEDKGSIKLDYTQEKVTVDFESEQEMLALVNEERRKAGIKSLEWDAGLADVARRHSADMFKRGYFSHYSPEGEDVGDRLTNANRNYSVAGENLALAPDISRAHTGLMDSPGHKRNILDPAFTKVGIGTIDGGVYGKMFTQVFTN